MRKWRVFFNICARSAALFLVCAFCSPSFAVSEGKIVAQVAESSITETDLQDALEQYMPSGGFHTGIDRSSKDEYRVAALNDLINRELLWREAEKRGLKASEEAVESVMKLNLKRFGSKEKMKKALEERGWTPEGLREKVRKTDMAATVLKDLTAESRASDEEVKKYYEENRSKYRKPDALFLYHILINVEPSASEELWQEKKKFAEQLLEKIKAGADFGSIAYQYSEDPYKYKSGELGFIHRGRLTPQDLEDAAFGLKKDEVSGVIRTIHGFHILKAGERMSGETKGFEDVRERIRKELDSKRVEEAKRALLERLNKEYPVKNMLELHQGDGGK